MLKIQTHHFKDAGTAENQQTKMFNLEDNLDTTVQISNGV